MTQASELYDQDFHRWIAMQVDLLKRGRTAEIDVEHLIAELEDMGKSNLRELESRLIVLLAHLLKWEYQRATLAERWREFEGQSWRKSIIEQRVQIAFLLSKVPSLSGSLQAAIAEAYPEAQRLAIRETGLDAQTFPAQCPYAAPEVLDQDFYPESPKAAHPTASSAES